MTSAVAIITFRRAQPLKTLVDSLAAHCATEDGKPRYPVAIFEDCANYDATYSYLARGTYHGYDAELDADHWTWDNGVQAFIGRRNDGVAGVSNKALRWFERQETFDHLCLCNDDLVATGDFVADYARAHTRTNVGLFCFADLPGEDYVGTPISYKGVKLKLRSRMVGSIMSVSRQAVKLVGYFDARFGRFGNEHCDYNNRARFSGLINVHNQAQHCLDVDTPHVHQQVIPSSVEEFERPSLDQQANAMITECAEDYAYRGMYRPYRLPYARRVGGAAGAGFDSLSLDRLGYQFVQDRLTLTHGA